MTELFSSSVEKMIFHIECCANLLWVVFSEEWSYISRRIVAFSLLKAQMVMLPQIVSSFEMLMDMFSLVGKW